MVMLFIGLVVGACVGMFVTGLMTASADRDDEQCEDEKLFCKDCDNAVPGDDLGCYWCSIYGEVYGHSDAERCLHFTNIGR